MKYFISVNTINDYKHKQIQRNIDVVSFIIDEINHEKLFSGEIIFQINECVF